MSVTGKKIKKTVKKKGRHSEAKKEQRLQVTHTRKPDNMSDKEWQTLLRNQIAQKENFSIKNLGHHTVYSDYNVFSTKTKNTYKVALRSKDNSLNFCSCPDFKTNQLGTCKHIEAVRLCLGKKRGIRKMVEEIPVFAYSSIYVSYLGERKVKLRIGADNKKKFESWSGKYFDAEYSLLPDAYLKMEKLLHEAYSINSSFRCYEDALELILTQRNKIQREYLVQKEGVALVKNLVKVPLFPYQKKGILFATRVGRSILADDMGLGKTLQAIGWALLMQKKFNTQKVIVICPTSLKYQWKAEIEKFSGSKVTVIEGNLLARKSQYENDENYFKIISYHMAGRDWEAINQMRPDLVILDEAQRIKNWKAKISQSIKRIRSPYALVLTGTPLENNIEELYSLVQYINPFLLGSLHNFLTKHQTKDELAGKVTGYTGLNKIGVQLSGILLRRNKKEVLKELPGRIDKNLFVPLTMPQLELHKEFADNVAKIVNKWKRFGFLNEQDRQMLMINLNQMRMVCNSTYIIDQQTNHQTKIDELFNILDELFLMQGEKVVIFSQWERMTRLIAMGLEQRKVKFENLHGGIPGIKRGSLFKNFSEDPDCKVFLSTDAGGVGLNLQAASYLINMDIPWNPAVLEQRIARIYRMGQKKNVSIINLVAQDTIEHRMLSVLKFKSAIAAGILDKGEDCIFLGDDRFKKFMQSVESITQDLPVSAITFDAEEQKEIARLNHEEIKQESFIADIPEDDPADSTLPEKNAPEAVTKDNKSALLVETGMSFISQLINTLSDQEAVKSLTESITEKDDKTGQTWLKIPVENKDIVEKALNMLAGFFTGSKK